MCFAEGGESGIEFFQFASEIVVSPLGGSGAVGANDDAGVVIVIDRLALGDDPIAADTDVWQLAGRENFVALEKGWIEGLIEVGLKVGERAGKCAEMGLLVFPKKPGSKIPRCFK